MKTYKKSNSHRGFATCFVAVQLLFMPPLIASDILDRLQGYEWKLPAEPLREEGAQAELIRIASDRTQPNFIRARAVAALTVYPSDEVWTFYSARITAASENNPANKVSRRRTVDALCSTFLPDRAEAIQVLLTPLLNEDDAHLRVRVAQCLENIDSHGAKSALGSYRSGIGESWELKAGRVAQ
ncbi:MAG TPA: hypothetical protein DCM54_02100 [Gammaproteobacteria bacterium]|nr:hypothetical protein [Gammaproteobacteria bacterium]|tara:strand:- start:2075 stop:2626 length:552 start_codon:yes stop_codon:yes gene_type:complete